MPSQDSDERSSDMAAWRRTLSTNVRDGCLVLSILAVALSAPVASASGPDSADAYRLIERIEQADADRLFDAMHGNASDDLQALMRRRFRATDAVIAAIDRLDARSPGSANADALLHVLGFVMDPASIPWLRRRLHRGDHDRLAKHWLLTRHHVGSWLGDWHWLEGRSAWVDFFIDLHASDPDPERQRLWLMQLLSFPDSQVRAWERRVRGRTTDPGTFLLIESARFQRGEAVEWPLVADQVRSLAREPANTPFLVELAKELRHELFVPFLLENYAFTHPYHGSGPTPAAHALMLIAMRHDLRDRAQWLQWWSRHRSHCRHEWMAERQDAFDALLEQDEAKALAYFQRAVYAWGDMAFLPYVERRLADRPAFRNELAGWVNLAYRPAHHAVLRRLVERLRVDEVGLEDWARRLLVERRLIPDDSPDDWSRVVRRFNSRL